MSIPRWGRRGARRARARARGGDARERRPEKEPARDTFAVLYDAACGPGGGRERRQPRRARADDFFEDAAETETSSGGESGKKKAAVFCDRAQRAAAARPRFRDDVRAARTTSQSRAPSPRMRVSKKTFPPPLTRPPARGRSSSRGSDAHDARGRRLWRPRARPRRPRPHRRRRRRKTPAAAAPAETWVVGGGNETSGQRQRRMLAGGERLPRGAVRLRERRLRGEFAVVDAEGRRRARAAEPLCIDDRSSDREKGARSRRRPGVEKLAAESREGGSPRVIDCVPVSRKKTSRLAPLPVPSCCPRRSCASAWTHVLIAASMSRPSPAFALRGRSTAAMEQLQLRDFPREVPEPRQAQTASRTRPASHARAGAAVHSAVAAARRRLARRRTRSRCAG